MRALLLLLFLSLGCAAQPVPGGRPGPPVFPAPERQWALLVGVSKYLHLPESEWLDGCDADASSLAQFLASPRGGSFPADHLRLLVNDQATITTIRLAMDSLIKRARAGDVVYIFFACHGKVELYGSGEVAYLLPYDCDPEHLNATALPMDEVRRYVDVNLRQCQVVLISDACHAGGLGPVAGEQRRMPSIADHLLDIGERSGALNIMACRRDESAVEDPRLGGHGLLTYCLLKALNGDGGSAPDGTVRAQDVLEYLMRQVPRLADSEQHPRHSSNYNDDFPMAQLKRPGAELDLPPIPSNSVTSVSGDSLASTGAGTACLRVLGAAAESELYLVQGKEQRTIGRALSAASMLILDGIPPGHYQIVQSLAGKQTRWPIQLAPGLHSFEVPESR